MASVCTIPVVLFGLLSIAFAGSPCPPRENIYPCSCVSLPQGKNVQFTIVTCHKMKDTDSFVAIFSTLRSMQIDHFYLFDSFWEPSLLGTPEAENKQVLPADWLTLLRIKELEIVDTTLSSCFACHGSLSCRNGVTTRFTAVNSSNSEKVCTICGTGNSKFSWTGCMSKLQHFHFSHSKLSVLRSDFFPIPMNQLVVLNLTHNEIIKVEANALARLPRLVSLDLSHNALQAIENLFSDQSTRLEFLDISYNMIKTLGPNLFRSVPSLKRLHADNNLIVSLKQSDWKDVPSTLRNIDLRDNPLHCDCDIRWINTTFHINVVLQGVCASPEDYENSQLRRASRLLNERCDEDGNIGTRPPKTKFKLF
ncbi:toll-like receptor 9 [Uloborus diversus]|uniref:toll-like receptor 9 n=1 Tax=Uloborus diversus TaxID=327109 RepID=UPI002409147A|nr:toll-like receptor 9 [Uloborus diversus]XP_054708010.1 toll-like receptor 9 [Uloborus diversus]